MTVDGEGKKIVLLTEGDEMKGKCEEKDLQLDELFRSAVEETPAPRESAMLPAKELLRNKQAQNRENAEKKRRFWGRRSMLRLAPALCALLVFGLFGGIAVVNRPKDQYAPLRFEEFGGLTNLRYSTFDDSCEEDSEAFPKKPPSEAFVQDHLTSGVSKKTVKFSPEKVSLVESRSYIPQNGSQVVLRAMRYWTEYGEFILYAETGEYSLERFPEPEESVMVNGQSYLVFYGGEDVAYARFSQGDYRYCLVFPDNTLETAKQILALILR